MTCSLIFFVLFVSVFLNLLQDCCSQRILFVLWLIITPLNEKLAQKQHTSDWQKYQAISHHRLICMRGRVLALFLYSVWNRLRVRLSWKKEIIAIVFMHHTRCECFSLRQLEISGLMLYRKDWTKNFTWFTGHKFFIGMLILIGEPSFPCLESLSVRILLSYLTVRPKQKHF